MKDYNFYGRCVILFAVGFAVGAVMQVFACKTKLYEIVAEKKGKRRLDLEEWVVEYRSQVEKWALEDKLKYEARQNLQQQRQVQKSLPS